MTAQAAYPWEAAPSGVSAAFAGALRAMLPRLETKRLVLRAPVIEDFDTYREILMSDRAVHMGGPFDRKGAWLDFVQCIANWPLRGHGLFTMETKNGAAVLGFVNLTMEWGDREPELGWFITENAEGHGYAFEAARAVRAWGLQEMRLSAMVSYVDRDNTRSCLLAERLGGQVDAPASAALSEEQNDDVLVFRHWPPMDEDGGMEAYA